jgi:Zn-dependent M28 family amino/carboxypeptidase
MPATLTRFAFASAACLVAACSSVQTPPPRTDDDTKAWWSITGDLSADDMEGRDTGSEGHAKAVRYVIDRMQKAGLKPVGENGGWTQTLPLKEVKIEKDGTSFEIARGDKSSETLRFLHEINVRVSAELPESLEASLAFRGYCSDAEMKDIKGKAVICFGARRTGLPNGGGRLQNALQGGAAAILNLDDVGYTLEPMRWPDAYARSVSFPDAGPPANPKFPVIRLAPDALAKVIKGANQDAAAILKAGAAGAALPSFDIPSVLKATFRTSQRNLSSDNVLGLLPGTDPALKDQVVIVSAHLDGYGYGEPVNGDNLYNGAFDDAAYVASLIRLAEQRAGKGFRRSVLFAVYTGEEKGLLGSTYFSTHLTVPKQNLAAVINLDQLRPLFPLKILTMHAIDDTTLANNVRRIAGPMGITVRPDLEPERNLNQRTDHWPFLRIGVPATNFVFGYDPGTDAERRYREWYQIRYHRPQDDMTQPIDFDAARDINTFFYRLTEDVANDDKRPAFLPGSRQ